MSIRATDADDADVEELVGPRLLQRAVAAGHHDQHPVALQHVVDELHRALLPDGQRGQRVGERHRLAQRQDGQPGRQHAAGADRDLAGSLVAAAGDLDHDAPRATSIGTERGSGRASGSSTVRIPSR